MGRKYIGQRDTRDLYNKMKKSGFTLTEILVVLIIMTFVIGGAFAIYVASYYTWREAAVSVSLQRDAGTAMEKMVRGVMAPSETRKSGIREAKSFIVSSDKKRIELTSGVDNITRSFYQQADAIFYDPNILAAGDQFKIADKITDLNFEKINNKNVRISLYMKDNIQGKPIKIDLATQVTLRN